MDRRMRLAVIGIASALTLIAIIIIAVVVKKLTPSDEVMPLSEYYQAEDKEVVLILQDQIYSKKGLLINGRIYVDYDTVVQEFNRRFYWDYNENILTYTTPDEIIRADASRSTYTVTKSTIETEREYDYPIAEVFVDKVYVSLDFVQQYSDLTFQYYKDPNRVVINYRWGDYLYTEVSKATQLRYEPNIKSPILAELPVGTSLVYVDTEEAPEKGFVKVMTVDGIKGYVKKKATKEAGYKTLESSYREPEYSAQSRSKKINLVFHQVFNQDANGRLEELISSTKGVNVVSPTWFSIEDVSGTISSLASERYVSRANTLGLEVWALVSDFNEEVNMKELLTYTSRRDTLSNALIEKALAYKLNGINIDFEKIPSDAGVDYIQFLRELSVKCRNNGIVLSVDNYVPSPYTEYYDREEQGKIVDYLITMAYDEHHGNSEQAGPVSSIGFVKDAVENILKEVPKEKVIIAIPFYTRLWKEGADGGLSSETYAMSPAAALIENSGVKAKWDDASGCYYIEYTKEDGTYKMWQEEDKSIEEKMKVIYNANVAGVAEWKLGLENPSVWNVILRYLNQ
ncbi:MAG TPA: glycosyl hydrolase family 18 [Clostridiales bacterium]|nr:glycosyl hydrolase family 18 [Clostridiales bacterium]